DVEPKQRILDPDDQPMWESAKTVPPENSNSANIQLDVDDNFVINNTHLNMIRENKFDDEPTKGILDITAGGIFLYKIPNQAFRFLKDKVIFKHDWPIKFKNKHHRKSVSFADGSDSNTNNSRFMEKLKAMDSQIISLNEELQDIRNKYNELRNGNASKNHMNDDTPICECHEANYIQSEDYQNLDSHNSFSRQSHYDPNDSEKSLTVLNNDVRNDLKDFKRRIRSMRIVHWKLHNNNDGKTVITIHPYNTRSRGMKESIQIESHKSSTEHPIVNDFVVINIPEEDVEPKQIILDPNDQPIWENAKIVAPTPNSAIVQPNVDDNFVINSTHLKMIRENKFDGQLRADRHNHIREFLTICDMFIYGDTQSEAIKLLIFPFSLCDEAKTWFNDLNEESITSWEQMRRAFINRFFPPSLFNRLLLEIRSFSQLVCESLTDAWLRLKSMLRKCHGHGLTKGAIIQIFYHGLDEPT
ncbi:reverse transcriptase domain-containing protein, partial [Tanacetum coccineum]